MRVRIPVVLVLCVGFLSAWPGSLPVLASGAQGEASLQKVRYWCSARYTRVVLDLNREVDYRVGSLEKDDLAKKPARIYVDLKDTGVGEKMVSKMELTEGPVHLIRSGRHDRSTVRVVLDLRHAEDHNVFRLEEPFRIVLDLWWEKDGRGEGDASKGSSTGSSQNARKPRLPLIVLDPGHGGNDPGAVGKGGLKEKDVALAIARQAKSILEDQKKAVVILTRKEDKYLPLETRAWIANSKDADLFVSIHANAHPDRKVRGVETYYLDNTTDRAAMRVAALENKTSNKGPDDLSRILIDLRCNANALESNALANTMQIAVTEELSNRGYSGAKDLGAKGSLFYVLIGAHMPSILVEVAFITNPSDENRLRTPSFQKALAAGVARGIMDYVTQSHRFDLMARQGPP